MKLQDYLKTWTGARSENRYSRYIMLTMALALVISITWQSSRSVTVQLPPSPLMEPGWVGVNDASASVKESWALAIATLVGNVTPRTADFVAKAVGPILSPRIYAAFNALVNDQAKTIKDEQVTIQFSPTAVFYEPSKDVVIVSGEYVIRGIREAESQSVRTFTIGLKVRNYAITMTSLDVQAGPWRPDQDPDAKAKAGR